MIILVPVTEHHYSLELQLASPEEAETWVQGFLKVDLHGTKKEITDIDLTERYDFFDHD